MTDPDRTTVDRLLAEMESTWNEPEWEYQRMPNIERVIATVLDRYLYEYRAAVWECPAIVAAYEFAAQHTALATFNAAWEKIERRHGFRAERYPQPPVTVRARG